MPELPYYPHKVANYRWIIVTCCTLGSLGVLAYAMVSYPPNPEEFKVVLGVVATILLFPLIIISIQEKFVLHDSMLEHRIGLKHDKIPYESISSIELERRFTNSRSATLKLKFHTRRPGLNIFLGIYPNAEQEKIVSVLKEKALDDTFTENI